MKRFIDEQRAHYGVEPICRILPIAPSTYYEHSSRLKYPDKRPLREKKDACLKQDIRRIYEENYGVYGVRKIWHQLRRDGQKMARCTVERLMKSMGLKGLVRGKGVKTTRQDRSLPCPEDLVNRNFDVNRPNALWVSDFTYVSTQQGFVYVALIIDAFSRKIVGWKVSRSARTEFVLDALNQALCERQPPHKNTLIHHSDRGGQYLSLRYSGRLTDAGIMPSVGSVGDAYDNALAETINGLYKNELIYRNTTWKNMETVEMETLKWVDWFNKRRLFGPIGNKPPEEAEKNYHKNVMASNIIPTDLK